MCSLSVWNVKIRSEQSSFFVKVFGYYRCMWKLKIRSEQSSFFVKVFGYYRCMWKLKNNNIYSHYVHNRVIYEMALETPYRYMFSLMFSNTIEIYRIFQRKYIWFLVHRNRHTNIISRYVYNRVIYEMALKTPYRVNIIYGTCFR